MAYTVTFWGTRGSIPTPGAHTARYGGNTPCVAVEGTGRKGGGQLVILDAGTGIRALGRELVERQQRRAVGVVDGVEREAIGVARAAEARARVHAGVEHRELLVDGGGCRRDSARGVVQAQHSKPG